MGGKFLLFLPAGFQAHGKTRYPLLIFLHGSGEAGDDLEKVKVHGPPEIVASRPDFPFIVASPQSGSASTFDPVALNIMLDELLARLADRQGPRLPDRTEPRRHLELRLGQPQPGALRRDRTGVRRWEPGDACKLKDMPTWAFHGALDDAVPIDEDKAMIAAINACGGHAKLSVYPDIGHNVWDVAYADPKLYEWLLQQRRHAPAK